jgi:DNA-binding NarL/FixJ family response regulator
VGYRLLSPGARNLEGRLIQVLIVSDHPVVRAGLAAILTAAEDCRVADAVSSDELVVRSAELRPDVVLMEGESDEIEKVWRLAVEAPGAAVLFLGRDAGERRLRQCLQAGARGYLLWDAPPEEIMAAVRAVAQGLMVASPAPLQALLGPPPDQEPAYQVEPLTPRELGVLRLLAEGLPSKTIAARLGLSEHTVKFHIGSLLAKLGASSRTEAVTLAVRRGLLSL